MTTQRLDDAQSDWSPDDTTCTPFEAMWYWVIVILLTLLSVAAIAGMAGYLYSNWVA